MTAMETGSGLSFGTPLPLELKTTAGDGAWEVAGYASVFGVTDLGNDSVTRGAFAQSLRSGEPIRFLYGHDPRQVLGTTLSLVEDDHGLRGRWRISKTQLGADVRTLLQDGALDSFSIGFVPKDWSVDQKSGTRHLQQLDLVEVSVVSMPMLPAAKVTGVKAAPARKSLVADYLEQRVAQLKAREYRLRLGRMTPEQVRLEVDAMRLRLLLPPAVGGR
jgi:HK97 family phage prohead protease